MARLPFEEINLKHQQTRPINKQVLLKKDNHGLDTETLFGYVRLLCDDTNILDKKSPNYNPPLFIENSIFSFKYYCEKSLSGSLINFGKT